MTARIQTAENQNLLPVQVGRLDCASGIRVAVEANASSETEALSAGVYLISATTPLFFSTGLNATAGDANGSLVIAPGAIFPVLIAAGEKISGRAIAEPGALFIVPMQSA